MESSKIKITNLLFCTLFIFFSTVQLTAQEDYDEYSFEGLSKKNFKTTTEDKAAVFKLSFLFPSVGTEIRLAKKFSLDISGRLGMSAYAANTGPLSVQFYFFPQPKIHFEPKWNYNIVKRAKRGKKTTNFSSNFLSLHTHFNIKVSNPTLNILVIGPTWGIQRTIRKIGYFKFKSGLGYRHVFNSPANYIPIIPIINVQLGVIF
ncbi:MAG: hypothetical protein ACPGVH_00825 [Chitinophagales bacterium]